MFLRVKEKYVELFLWVIDGVIPKTEKRNGYLVNKENTESILFGTKSTNNKNHNNFASILVGPANFVRLSHFFGIPFFFFLFFWYFLMN